MKDKLDEILSDFLASNYGVYKGIGDTTEAKDRINAWKDQEMQRVVEENTILTEGYVLDKETIELLKEMLATYKAKVKQLEETIKHKDEHIDDITQNALNEWNILEGRLLNRQDRCNEAENQVKQLEQQIKDLIDSIGTSESQALAISNNECKRQFRRIQQLEAKLDDIKNWYCKGCELYNQQQIKESREVSVERLLTILNKYQEYRPELLQSCTEDGSYYQSRFDKFRLAIAIYNLIYGDKQGE